MDGPERQQLIDDLLRALERRYPPGADRLLDLMRAEQQLVSTLATIRREIELIISAETAR